jgi:hypothetical protein
LSFLKAGTSTSLTGYFSPLKTADNELLYSIEEDGGGGGG